MALEDSILPLGCRIDPASLPGLAPLPTGPDIHVRVFTRAFHGMQKEALIQYGPTGAIWRQVCDEGPYLNGTDLAPFPLAFFAAGMAVSYFDEIAFLARERGVDAGALQVTVDTHYALEGNFNKGTMMGYALPVELDVQGLGGDRAVLSHLVGDAVAAAPGNALLREIHANLFSVFRNGQRAPAGDLNEWTDAPPPMTLDGFDGIRATAPEDFARDMIVKLKDAEIVHDPKVGANIGYNADQKRALHIRAICHARADGIKEIEVQLFKPVGSNFRLMADTSTAFGGKERAPSGLALISAGISFCYMTQLGRYAKVRKTDVSPYWIIQDTVFSRPGASGGTGRAASASPAKTHVFLTTEADPAFCQELVRVSENTCYLHATYRSDLKSRLRIAA